MIKSFRLLTKKPGLSDEPFPWLLTNCQCIFPRRTKTL